MRRGWRRWPRSLELCGLVAQVVHQVFERGALFAGGWQVGQAG